MPFSGAVDNTNHIPAKNDPRVVPRIVAQQDQVIVHDFTGIFAPARKGNRLFCGLFCAGEDTRLIYSGLINRILMA
jgi:hypothetical protein